MSARLAGLKEEVTGVVEDIVDGLGGWMSETGDFPDQYWKKDVLRRYDECSRRPPTTGEMASLLADLVDGLEGVASEMEMPSRYWKPGLLARGRKAVRDVRSALVGGGGAGRLASELVAVAEELVAAWGLSEPLEVRVSRTEEFEEKEAGFDKDVFERAVTRIVRRYGFATRATQGLKYGGQWTWTWDLPEDAEKFLANMKHEIKRLPEWGVLYRYGAIIEIGQN